MKKLLFLQVAGLDADSIPGCRAIKTVFPAVTCTVQATLRTGLLPEETGMPANGFYDRNLRKTWFWEQSSALVKGRRIWEKFREAGGTVGLYFFQQSLGENVDEIISPAPIHCHGGKMIMDCYQFPENLIDASSIKLWQYWGPLASWKGSRAIANLLVKRLERNDAPDFIMAYLPGLDYDLQRYGKDAMRTKDAADAVLSDLIMLQEVARKQNYEIVIVGDYAIENVTKEPICLNKVLLDEGLMSVRNVKGKLYPDFHRSKVFAVTDHQVALIYIQDSSVGEKVFELLSTLDGVDSVRTGTVSDFIVEAKPGTWFYWSWWTKNSQAPDYAAHVDIHNKPGFDPCELFFGKTPFSISLKPEKVGGTHGRNERPVALTGSLHLDCCDMQSLANAIESWLTS